MSLRPSHTVSGNLCRTSYQAYTRPPIPSKMSKFHEQGWGDTYTEKGDLGIEIEATRGYSSKHTSGDFVTRVDPAQKHPNETKRLEKN